MSTYNLGTLFFFFYEYSIHLEHLPTYFWVNIGKIFLLICDKNFDNNLFIFISK